MSSHFDCHKTIYFLRLFVFIKTLNWKNENWGIRKWNAIKIMVFYLNNRKYGTIKDTKKHPTNETVRWCSVLLKEKNIIIKKKVMLSIPPLSMVFIWTCHLQQKVKCIFRNVQQE